MMLLGCCKKADVIRRRQ